MITYSTQNSGAYYDLRGLSTDNKPIDGIPNGSTYMEIDTATTYMFDQESKTWWKM